jgi:predicted helicase
MKMNFELLKQESWFQLESKLEDLTDNKEKGDLFEYFAYFYLHYNSHLYDIEEIYCPIVDGKPFPKKILDQLKLETKDNGVDGVYITTKGKYIAWQAKFRSKRATLTARELSTFWAEAEYADYRLIISNTSKLPTVAGKKSGHLSLLVDHFEGLKDDFFANLYGYFSDSSFDIIRTQKTPRDYQQEILTSIVDGFKENNKGKVIAACGIGKTLISLWATENLESKTVIFFAPSLQLVRQTLEEWANESSEPFSYLCVCSDQTVNDTIDHNTISLDEIDIPVTTDSDGIKSFLRSTSGANLKFLFSTYQSANVVSSAIEDLTDFSFDLAIYDEAHRTTGVGENALFSLSLDDKLIPSKKKLFLTATERLLRPSLQNSAAERGIAAFTMSDEKVYGPVFHKLTFGEAIEKKIISDYRIVFSAITNSELIKAVQSNKYVSDEMCSEDKEVAAQNLYKRLILKKSIKDLGINKVISFHSKISESKQIASSLQSQLKDELPGVNTFISHINGSMSAQERSEIIHQFEDSEIGVISNVRCLTEGVDIPLIDGVFFADPKGSLIDIVQAVGRALRQPYGTSGKISYIVIPVLIDDNSSELISGQGFEALFNLIQALRDQDHSLAEWIDGINSAAVRGRSSSSTSNSKLKIIVPESIDFEKFEDLLTLEIADVNKDPTGTTGIGSKLGKSERKGSIARVFKTMIDYRYDSCEASLVTPTLEKMAFGQVYSTKEIKINNNNVSHCQRLGLIKEIEKAKYTLTPIGNQLKDGSLVFETIFKNQMLVFGEEKDGKTLFPYRTAMSFLYHVKNINFIQFIYSIYSIGFDDKGNADIDGAVERASWIKENYPNIHLTNETNKPNVLNELNSHFGLDFSFNNVWTDRTTVGNQYRYLIRHLELFEDLFELNGKIIRIKPGADENVTELLDRTAPFINSGAYGEKMWINN